jgi:serine/threonine protein kinase
MVASNWVNLEGETVGQKYHLDRLIEPGSHEAWFSAEAADDSAEGKIVVALSTRAGAAAIRPEELDHPNLRRVFASGTDRIQGLEVRYASLESVGESLADVLGRGPLDERAAAALALDIVSALHHLHRRRYVYAGLRPTTVAHTDRGWVLSDFELLRREGTVDPAETRLMLAASPHVPPDAYGGLVSPAWDLWSLGVLLNQALTAAQRSGRRNKPSPAPPPFDSIIRGCLDPNPNERIGLRDVAGLLGADLHSLSERATAGPAAKPAPVLQPAHPEPSASSQKPPLNGIEVRMDLPAEIRPGVPAANQPHQRRRSRVYSSPEPKQATNPWSRPPNRTARSLEEIPSLGERVGSRKRVWAIVALGVLALGIGVLLAVLNASGDIEDTSRRAGQLETPPQQEKLAAASRERPPERKLPDLPAADDPAARKAAIFPFVLEWAGSMRELDLDRHIRTYAPMVDTFFTKRAIPQSQIRAEKQRLFSGISNVRRFGIRDIRIESFEPDRAIVNFRKDWDLRGRLGSVGAERERLTLRWIDGGWRITSEQGMAVSRARRSRPTKGD